MSVLQQYGDTFVGWQFSCPSGWEVVQRWGDGYALRQRDGGLRVLVDCTIKTDGLPWLHVSVSRKHWTPTHEDMAVVKRDFIGPRLYAYAIWPPVEHHVNIHPHCLHLWACVNGGDGRMLPEFSDILPEIGLSI